LKGEIYIDAHAHIDRYELLDERVLDSALAEISRNKIFTISNSMEATSYQRNLEISAICEWLVPIFGIHPWNAMMYADRLDDVVESIQRSPMIGEIGMDHYFIGDAAAYPAQRKVLEYFLAAAENQNKIVNLHTKGAEKEFVDLLNHYELPGVIVHWYSGPLDVFNELVEMGVYFTVGVEVLHSEHIRTIAHLIPERQLLTETDNPGGPKTFTGSPGMPVLIHDIVQGIAEVRGTSSVEIMRLVQSNFETLINDNQEITDLYNKVLR